MNTDNTQAFEEYAELDKQKKAIEARQKELKEILMDLVPQEGRKFEYGSFYYTTRKSWNYSADVKALEGDLKDLKKKEEKTGKATFTESKSLAFKLSKNED